MERHGVVADQVITKYTDEEEDPAPVAFYSMDDKTKIDVGDPHLFVSFGRRGCCNILSTTDVKAIITSDHYFKFVSLTPSVKLRVDFKHDEGENGTAYYISEVFS
jgi:hypothetical protein